MPKADSPFEEMKPGGHLAPTWHAPEDETALPLAQPPDTGLRGLWSSLIVIGVLLAAYGVWSYCSRTRSFHQVARFTFTGRLHYPGNMGLFPAQQGFLLCEAGNTFTMHDWRRGDVRWRVVVNMREHESLNFSLSPNGRYFAVLKQSNSHLQLWDNGILTSDTSLYPNPIWGNNKNPLLGNTMNVMDDGRVLVWSSMMLLGQSAPLSDALLLQQGKIIARGPSFNRQFHTPGFGRPRGAEPSGLPRRKFRAVFSSPHGQWNDGGAGGAPLISPDGSAIIVSNGNSFAYGTFSITHGRLVPTLQYCAQDQLSFTPFVGGLFNDGIVLSNTGAVYDRSGKRLHCSGWGREVNAPGGLFTFEYQDNMARVFSPVTGERWSFSVPGKQQGGAATMDGHFALAWYRPQNANGLDTGIYENEHADHSLSSKDMLALYERPGRLRAKLPFNVKAWWKQPGSPHECWWYPSPDGHTVVFTLVGDANSECLLFRW